MRNKTNIAIEVRSLSVRYKNGHTAVKNATVSISRGSISGLVGINGAGKSTIFRALRGFLPIAEGAISILGDTVNEALRSGVMAYVPQSEEVDWSFPVLVEDVVMMGRYGHMGFFVSQRNR